MAANPQQSSLSGLARALVQAGRIKEAEAESLLSQAAASKSSFIEQLVSAKKASAADIARFAADTFGYPLLDLGAFDDVHVPKSAIDRKLIATHRVIPLHKRGNRLSVAISDPTNLRALDEIRFQTGMAVDPVIVEDTQLAPLVAKLSESAEETLKNLADEDINLEFTDEDSQEKSDEASALEVDDAPVVKFIQKMLLDAIKAVDGGELKTDRLCELNVIEQAINVCETTVVREAWDRGQSVEVHGWIYGLTDGLIRDMGMCAGSFDEMLENYERALAALS